MQNKMETFEGHLSVKAEQPTYREIKDASGRIIDYQDVRIDGYANTFNVDRGNEQVIPGAFAEKLDEFLTNPILLCDHMRESAWACGSVQSAYEDNIGLKISGILSNSPSEKMKDLRFKCVERVLRTFSIGGKFIGRYASNEQDAKFIISQVELREISIVTVPMNKESLFEVKQDGNQSAKTSAPENTVAEQSQGDRALYVLIDGKKHKITEEKKDGLIDIRSSIGGV